MVMVDSVYSMDGDVAPLPRIHEICQAAGVRRLRTCWWNVSHSTVDESVSATRNAPLPSQYHVHIPVHRVWRNPFVGPSACPFSRQNRRCFSGEVRGVTHDRRRVYGENEATGKTGKSDGRSRRVRAAIGGKAEGTWVSGTGNNSHYRIRGAIRPKTRRCDVSRTNAGFRDPSLDFALWRCRDG